MTTREFTHSGRRFRRNPDQTGKPHTRWQTIDGEVDGWRSTGTFAAAVLDEIHPAPITVTLSNGSVFTSARWGWHCGLHDADADLNSALNQIHESQES